MRSGKKFSILGTLIVGVISLLLIALPGTAAAGNHHQRHYGHHGHHGHQRHHSHQRHHRTGTGTGTTSDDNAGAIASFDGTTLVITLTDGSSASGLVTDATEIKCESNSGDTGDDDGDNGDTGDTGDDDGDNGDTGDDDATGGDDGQASAPASKSDEGDTGDTGDDDGDTGDTGDDDGDNGDNDDGDTGEGQCTTADLTPGTVVQEAELTDVNGQATFTEIELVK